MNDQQLLDSIREIVQQEVGRAVQALPHIERKLSYLVDAKTGSTGANFSGVRNMTKGRAEEIGVDLPDLELSDEPATSVADIRRAHFLALTQNDD